MIVTSLNLNIEQTLRAARRMHAKAPTAVARALNRSVGSGLTVLVRLGAKDLGIKQSFVRARLSVRKATPDTRPMATISANARRIPSVAFAPTPSQPPSRGRGRGVSWRSQGARVRDTSAFIARMDSGHVGIFKREGASRRSDGAWSKNLPIRELMGPSVWKVAVKFAGEALARAQEQLVKNLQHELRFAISK